MDLKEALLLNTLVFETLGDPQKEREFKIKSLKKWGFDLVFGKIDNEENFFLANNKKEGQSYEADGQEYEVIEILKELPKEKKIFAHIEMIEGRAYLFVDLKEKDERVPLLQVPAGEILLAFLKKHKFKKIIDALKNIGVSLSLVKHEGESGNPLPFNELPPIPRRFLRDAKKIEKEIGFGRIALAYFGENKDKKARFYLEWMVPTISLFDEEISQKIDKTLAEFI